MKTVETMLSVLNMYCNENKYYSAFIVAENEKDKPTYAFTGDAIGVISAIKLLLQQVCQSANIDYATIAKYLYETRYDDVIQNSSQEEYYE